jgi:galactokinase/mevalonate kinase-like predicted kinase
MINLHNKGDVKALFGLGSAVCFLAGIVYAFDDFNASKGVVFMLGSLVMTIWKNSIKE